jgi:hypothetical protein
MDLMKPHFWTTMSLMPRPIIHPCYCITNHSPGSAEVRLRVTIRQPLVGAVKPAFAVTTDDPSLRQSHFVNIGNLSAHVEMFPPPQHPIGLGRGWYFWRGNPAYPSYPSNWIDLYGPGASKRLILEMSQPSSHLTPHSFEHSSQQSG